MHIEYTDRVFDVVQICLIVGVLRLLSSLLTFFFVIVLLTFFIVVFIFFVAAIFDFGVFVLIRGLLRLPVWIVYVLKVADPGMVEHLDKLEALLPSCNCKSTVLYQ